LAITPQPERQPAPITVGSASHNSAVWAAQNDLPYATITWPLVSFELYKEKRAMYLEAGRAAGYDVKRHLCPHFLYMYCGESDNEATEVVKHYMTQFQYINEHHYELGRAHHQNQAVQNSHGMAAQKTNIPVAERVRKLTQQTIDYHIIGGTATCQERVRAYQDEAKVNYIVLNMKIGSMPQELHAASMRRFAEHVMPHFTDSSRA
jgi:alkanesulfonate monooxygenase SsuD/methylene tetrahydromethanopterin reductase-like flavin-dependent oxidoreductase (luciferase family)